MLEFLATIMPAATKVTIIIIEIYTDLEYAFLELKLLSTAVGLYSAILHCSFVAAVALHLWSLLVHLIAQTAANL